jgi:Tol biopolymer transport system component
MGATGESVRRVTDFGYNPVWSPEGDKIVFATEGVYGSLARWTSSHLWVVNIQNGDQQQITELDAVQPNWSPGGHRIAYWSAIGTGQRDIWTIPAGGGDAVPVTDDAHIDWNPVWSPDGSYLYFSSDRGGSMNLWRVPIEEESGEILGPFESVTTGASASHRHISFSRDSTRMAYVEHQQIRNIWKVAFDPETATVQGEPIPVTKGSRLHSFPEISLDGEWIAYSSLAGKQEDIFILRPDGTDVRQLTDDIHIDRFPRWWPNGEKIVFMSNRTGSYRTWTINPDGSGLQHIQGPPGRLFYGPDLSPESFPAVCVEEIGKYWVFDSLEPWDEQTAVRLPPFSDRMFFEFFSWSPDGSHLAGTVRHPDGSSAGIALYSLESQQYTTLTDFGSRPVWLPDGRRLLFHSESAIYLLDIESGEREEILSVSPNRVSTPTFSPQSPWMYFHVIADEADIWLLTLDD